MKKKTAIIIISSVLAVVLLGAALAAAVHFHGAISAFLDKRRTVNEAVEILDSKNFEEICEKYGEIFNTENYEEMLRQPEGEDPVIFKMQGKYLASLLFTENYDKYKEEREKFARDKDSEDLRNLCVALAMTLNKDTLDNDELYKKIYRNIAQIEVKMPTEKGTAYYCSTMHFAGMCLNSEEDLVSGYEEKMRETVLNLEADYEKFYITERRIFAAELLKNDYYDRFDTMFCNAFGDGTIFEIQDYYYLIHLSEFDNEQLKVLKASILNLAEKTSIDDQKKITTLKLICDAIETE